jgi:hypothetical protein
LAWSKDAVEAVFESYGALLAALSSMADEKIIKKEIEPHF